MTPGIEYYIFKYIQNLDKVLVDIAQVGIIIPWAKSPFYWANLHIIGYISNTDNCHPDISKVLWIVG